MKPSVTIDERGVILHVTTDAGEGVAIPLEPATVLELAAGFEAAKARLKTPAGRWQLAKGIASLFGDLGKGRSK